MMNCSFFDKAGDCRDFATARIESLEDIARTGYDIAYGRISCLLSKFVLSGILKIMMISFGILLGATFSGFFKKHRKIVLIAFLASVALFVYKAFQLLNEWDESVGEF